MPDSGKRNSSVLESQLSRRRWLEVTGAAGISALAGCSGGTQDDGTTTSSTDDSTDSNDESTDDSSDEPVTLTRTTGGTHPSEINWNPNAANGYSGIANRPMKLAGARVFAASGEAEPVAHESWEYDQETNIQTRTLRDDLEFWNGDPYTAEDLYVQSEMERLMGYLSGPSVDKIEQVDERTLEFHYEDAHNPKLLEKNTVALDVMGNPASVWRPWLEKLQDASNEDARDKIVKDITEMSISTEELMENDYGIGPYKLASVDDNGYVYELVEDHPWADPIDIDQIQFLYADETARRDQLIINGKVDFGNPKPLPNSVKGAAPDHLEDLAKWEGKWMVKMLVNWTNREYLRDANVRRAMAAVIDSKNIATNMGGEVPIQLHSGMDAESNDVYLGDTQNDYIDYGTTAKHETADRFLEKSGYSRKNGTVVDPDGNELEKMRFVAGTTERWFVPARTASAQLQEYGFPVEFNSVERSSKIDRLENDMSSWDLSTESHYAGITYHPISYFNPGSFWGWRLVKGTFGPSIEDVGGRVNGWLDEGKAYSPYSGKPLVAEVPTKIGSEDLSGSTEKLNIWELYNEAQGPVSEQRDREIVRKLSWAWNFYMPDIDLINMQQGVWGNTRDFEWPEGKALTGANGTGSMYSYLHGLVKPK